MKHGTNTLHAVLIFLLYPFFYDIQLVDTVLSHHLHVPHKESLERNGTRESRLAKPSSNPDDAGPIVHRLMGLPVTADCDTARDRTRICSDTPRPLRHSGGPNIVLSDVPPTLTSFSWWLLSLRNIIVKTNLWAMLTSLRRDQFMNLTPIIELLFKHNIVSF